MRSAKLRFRMLRFNWDQCPLPVISQRGIIPFAGLKPHGPTPRPDEDRAVAVMAGVCREQESIKNLQRALVL